MTQTTLDRIYFLLLLNKTPNSKKQERQPPAKKDTKLESENANAQTETKPAAGSDTSAATSAEADTDDEGVSPFSVTVEDLEKYFERLFFEYQQRFYFANDSMTPKEVTFPSFCFWFFAFCFLLFAFCLLFPTNYSLTFSTSLIHVTDWLCCLLRLYSGAHDARNGKRKVCVGRWHCPWRR